MNNNNNIDTNSQEVSPSAHVTSPSHSFFVHKEEYSFFFSLFYQAEDFRKHARDSRLKGDRRFSLSDMLQANHLLSRRVTRRQLSASPFSFPPSRRLLFLGRRTKPIKTTEEITAFFADGRRKLIASSQHTVQHMLCCPYMNHWHQPTATSGQATPNPHLHATIFTTVQRNLRGHRNPPSSACKRLQAGAERKGGSGCGAALRYSRRPLVCRSHAPRPRQTQSYDAFGVHGERRRMNG